MKKLLLPALFFLFSFGGYSQTETNYPTYEKGYILLKSGEILKGKYYYSANLEKIIVITNEKTVILQADEVQKVTKAHPDKKRDEKVIVNEVYKPSRFFNITEIGALPGNDENVNKNPLLIHTGLHYSVTPAFSAGLGVGVELFKEAYLPVMANTMYFFNKNNRVKPYIALQGGYDIPIEKTTLGYYDVVTSRPLYYDYWSPYPYYQNAQLEAKGGFFVNPSVGFIYQLTNGFGLGVSLGYRHHVLNYYGDENYKLEVQYNRLSIKLGFIFN